MKKNLLLASISLPILGPAQDYSMNWHNVAGGGGSSAGTNSSGVWSVSGTIGQHDAGSAMTGGNYSLTGGFWSLISLVQTVGAPMLIIMKSGNSVIVSWLNADNYTLQQNSNLAVPSGWAASGYPIRTNNGANSITITSPTGNLFFRLYRLP